MLEPEEAVDLGLGREHQVCADQGLEFINCPIPDHGIPEEPALVIACVDLALARLRAGKRVAAHCFAGMGRSPLLVASIMVRSGLAPDIAWQEVVKARGLRLPDTDAQRRWVADLAAGLHSMPQAGPR